MNVITEVIDVVVLRGCRGFQVELLCVGVHSLNARMGCIEPLIVGTGPAVVASDIVFLLSARFVNAVADINLLDLCAIAVLLKSCLEDRAVVEDVGRVAAIDEITIFERESPFEFLVGAVTSLLTDLVSIEAHVSIEVSGGFSEA